MSRGSCRSAKNTAWICQSRCFLAGEICYERKIHPSSSRKFTLIKKEPLIYAEIIPDKKASMLTYFMARSLSWFKQIYNFEFEMLMSDNGPEFCGSLKREHPFEMLCQELGIKHIRTQAYRPQTNGKIEAF